MQVTPETFVCVACDQEFEAERLAFDTDPEHRLGVCTDCEPAVTAAEMLPEWTGREVA